MSVFNVVDAESAVLVVVSASLKITVAFHPEPGKAEEASVACAKYKTLNVVVVLILVVEQVLEAVNAVAV